MPTPLRKAYTAAPFWFFSACISGAAAIAVFVFRGDLLWLEYQPATLGEIYAPPPSAGARISGFDKNGHRLTVLLTNAGMCGRWRVVRSDGTTQTIDSPVPVITLVPGRHIYRVDPQGCPGLIIPHPLEFDIAFTPQADAPTDAPHPDLINLYRAPLEVAQQAGPDFTRWIPPLEDYPAADTAQAQQFLKRIGVTPNMTSREKITAVSVGLTARIKSGQPPADLDTMSPMQVLNVAEGKGIPLFCRQRALMKAFLLNVAGVPTRLVWSGRTIDGVLMSSHAFTESFVAEQGRWAYSDLSHNIDYLTDPDGRVLNAADMLFLVSGGALSAAAAKWPTHQAVPGEVRLPLSADARHSLAGVFTRNATLQYWGAHDRFIHQMNPPFATKIAYRLRRYLLEPTLYIGLQRGYTFHWLRWATILAAFLSAVMVLVRTLRR
ncbi:hypothetical protein RJ527_00760 [Thalassospiraceae bacterium LMO-SO8]|nr:hypothetical protein [Alphaproteobacteria bacterium LMO-S08]WND76287.1 hypothetical protein RJ527_00760 [Thalassospiraceae bacterium LMO-SO8]